jgi:hypothetical protein
MFLQSALQQIRLQDYTNLEVVIVDDSPDEPVEESLRPKLKHLSKLGHFSWENLTLRIVYFPERKSIGAKRTAAVQAARGEFIAHWDDDDIHPRNRISSQLRPLLSGEAQLSAPFQDIIGHFPEPIFFKSPPSPNSLVLGALAYQRQVALKLGGFADTSFAEDFDFANRALASCRKLVGVNVSNVYVRHKGGAHNTWEPTKEEKAWLYGSVPKIVEPPAYLTQELLGAFQRAEEDVRKRGACSVQNAFKPKLHQVPHFPNMPDICAGDVVSSSPCSWTAKWACPSSPTPGTDRRMFRVCCTQGAAQ